LKNPSPLNMSMEVPVRRLRSKCENFIALRHLLRVNIKLHYTEMTVVNVVTILLFALLLRSCFTSLHRVVLFRDAVSCEDFLLMMLDEIICREQ
jgi:hypothetical protein